MLDRYRDRPAAGHKSTSCSVANATSSCHKTAITFYCTCLPILSEELTENSKTVTRIRNDSTTGSKPGVLESSLLRRSIFSEVIAIANDTVDRRRHSKSESNQESNTTDSRCNTSKESHQGFAVQLRLASLFARGLRRFQKSSLSFFDCKFIFFLFQNEATVLLLDAR